MLIDIKEIVIQKLVIKCIKFPPSPNISHTNDNKRTVEHQTKTKIPPPNTFNTFHELREPFYAMHDKKFATFFDIQ